MRLFDSSPGGVIIPFLAHVSNVLLYLLDKTKGQLLTLAVIAGKSDFDSRKNFPSFLDKLSKFCAAFKVSQSKQEFFLVITYILLSFRFAKFV